uniref:Uncharacterized protein n=1 Tax=Entomoneis paludosa TaxID=265537 RepID=A0A6U2YAY2_9STRA
MMNTTVKAATRRLVRSMSTKTQVDWSKPAFSGTPKIAAHFNAIKSWVSMADAEAEKYSAPPGPVDFAAAKASVRDKELVDILEAFYKANTPQPETHEWSTEDQEATDHQIAFMRDQTEYIEEALPVLKKELEFFKAVRTTKDTTYRQMCENHPVIHEEVEDELERREWFKDTEFDKSKDGAAAH